MGLSQLAAQAFAKALGGASKIVSAGSQTTAQAVVPAVTGVVVSRPLNVGQNLSNVNSSMGTLAIPQVNRQAPSVPSAPPTTASVAADK